MRWRNRLALAALGTLLAGSFSWALDGPANGSIPVELWVVPFSSSPSRAAEMVLAESLQGLTGRDLPKLWLDKNASMSEVILAQLEQEGTTLHRLNSVWDLPGEFWMGVDGYILYNLGTPSLNSAISLCGPWNAVAVDESIVDQAEAKGLTRIYDARGQTEDQIFDQYSDLFSLGIAVEMTETRPEFTRDFAVQNNAFTFYTTDSTFRRRVAAALGPGATFFGWGFPSVSEHTWISDFSQSSGQGAACGLCVNLSGMSKLPVPIPDRASHVPPDPAQEGQRIVAFVLSDGDNIRWLTGDMPLDPKFFASPQRGQINMNWEISPLLPDLAPRVLKYFYDSATDMDGFVASGSPEYRYIHFEPDPRGEIDAQQSAPKLDASHLSIVSIINDNEGGLEETIPLLDLPQVHGVIYKAFSPYNRLRGQMLCHQDMTGQDKFAVSYRFLLWESPSHPNDNPQGVADAIAQMPSSPQTDPGSYALINAHAWSWANIGGPVEAVKETIDLLPSNTRVVTVDDFFTLLNNNFTCGGSPFYNLTALGSPLRLGP